MIGLSFVIWALLGWEFAVAQAVGAPILIVLVITLVHLSVSDDEAEEVRQRLIKLDQPVVTDPVCKMRINRENALVDEHKNSGCFIRTRATTPPPGRRRSPPGTAGWKAPGDRVVPDPVTGKVITVKDADYCTEWEGTIYYFGSDDGRRQFRNNPTKFLDDGE